ncbi:protein kinase [Acidithiobacillus sp. AMEEHan]|uniref:protein kinase domain-containing protein n=1 Tax=Acidithiobacillus sp. AMEEHan TaxID=2994951 RepID=UPI0027E54B51|nr:protein kinase [Acidithiobacillus sp. AMEEHan]
MPRTYKELLEIREHDGDLFYRVFLYSDCAPYRNPNEDYIAFGLGGKTQRVNRGNILVLADGMSGGKAGRVAAELVARQLIQGYQELPGTYSIEHALSQSLAASNRSLHWFSRHDQTLEGMAAVFCAVVIRGWECYVCFAGDVRCYLWRRQKLQLVTTDHALKVLSGTIITRAVGFDDSIQAEFFQIDIEENDVILVVSDGCHNYLSMQELRETLLSTDSIAKVGELVNDLARFHGSRDDASIGIIEIVSLPKKSLTFFEDVVMSLPIGRLPAVGAVIDGYCLLEIIHDGYYSVLFRAKDERNGNAERVLKFPKARAQNDENVRRSFAKEDWVSSIVDSPWLARSAHDGRSRSQVYTVSPYYQGYTLAERIKKETVRFSDAIDIIRKISRALYELHRLNIVHRDIKPENIMLLHDGGVILLDYGFARVPGALDPAPTEVPGTLAYMAPELVNGGLGDSRSDVYALGVTFYQIFSGNTAPFGFQGYKSIRKQHPEYPAWVDSVLKKMLEHDPANRYSDTLELLYDIDKHERSFSSGEKALIYGNRISEILILRILVVILVFTILVMQMKAG